MTDTLTLTGLVATPPKHITTASGLAITSFRLASNQRRFDRTKGEWVDLETNWYTVTTFRQLAKNVVLSVQKGQRVVVTGRLRVREWTNEEKATKGTNVELDADALGHDLSWGTASFTRTAVATVPDEAPLDPETPVEVDSEDDTDASLEREAAGLATPF